MGESDIATNRAGTNRVENYIAPFGYEVHPMPMKGEILHLLGIMFLIKEGLLLQYRDELDCQLPNTLSEWEVIELTESEAKDYATVGVSLDDSRYIIPSGLGRVAEELSRRGIEPIEIDFDQVSYWGGCISCSTHAVSRDT